LCTASLPAQIFRSLARSTSCSRCAATAAAAAAAAAAASVPYAGNVVLPAGSRCTPGVTLSVCLLLFLLQFLQEDDVIGTMPSGDQVANMKPLGDRVLIKVGGHGQRQQLLLCMCRGVSG